MVSGDASTRVLNNEVSTVVTTCTGRAATPTDFTVLPQTTTDTQPTFQSDSSNIEDESTFLHNSPPLLTGDC